MTLPAPPAALQSASAIPFKRDNGMADSAVGGGVGVLIVSLIAIVAVLVIRKKLGLGQRAPGKTALLKVLETERMGPRALLSVVEFSGTRYLLAQGEQGITCIDSKPAGEQP